ncbi:MAG: hypothetical protein KC731_35585 [Myxococcales bacterium]|nr:hypothetical protein [Myxococcales bacterium]
MGQRVWALGLVAAALIACGGDGESSTTSSGGAGSTSSSSGGASAGAGGTAASGGMASTGGAGGAGGLGQGGAGGETGFPWDDALDPNGTPSSSRLTAREKNTTPAGQGFWEYLPSGYPGGAKWSLLVALHGVGENGNGTNELTKLLNTGIPKLINQDNWPLDRPFVVLMPQHEGGGCPGAGEIQAFIDYGIQTYEIDPRYVYLTGLSCGAIGSWGYLQQNLDSQIAAFVPIAGNGTGAWNNAGCDLAKVGIWAFHGDADGTVDVSGTNTPMDGLATCPSPPALETKKTIYPGVGHNSWDRTYDLSEGHDIYTWMLGFTHTP